MSCVGRVIGDKLTGHFVINNPTQATREGPQLLIHKDSYVTLHAKKHAPKFQAAPWCVAMEDFFRRVHRKHTWEAAMMHWHLRHTTKTDSNLQLGNWLVGAKDDGCVPHHVQLWLEPSQDTDGMCCHEPL